MLRIASEARDPRVSHLGSPPTLQTAVSHGQLGISLRHACPSLFWNLVLWLLSFALPIDNLAHLSRGEDDGLGLPEVWFVGPESDSGGRAGSIRALQSPPPESAFDTRIVSPGGAAMRGLPVSERPAGSGGLRAEAAALIQRLPSVAARTAVAAATAST